MASISVWAVLVCLVFKGAVMAGAERIIAIDINPDKFEFARQLGATHFINPNDVKGSFVEYMQDTL